MIKCNLCGYEFKTISKIETRYIDYEYDEEICYYPAPEENAHLVKNYICDSCYNNIGNKVKESLIKSGETYISNLCNFKKEIYAEYLESIEKLEEKASKIQMTLDKLKIIKELYEITEDEISYISQGYPYAVGGTYYLNDAIKIEKENKLGLKTLFDWCNLYNVEIGKTPKKYDYRNMISKDEFKSVIMDSQINNMTSKEIFTFVNNI